MKLVLGTMTMGKQVEADEAALMLADFVGPADSSSGARHDSIEVDTAYVYNGGRTESMLGDLLSVNPNPAFQLAGKANPAAPGRLTREGISNQLDTSLKRLRQDSLDLFYLHSPDLETPIEESLEAINDAYQAGKIRRFGLSNYAAWQVAQIYEKCDRHGWLKPVCYQGMYNAITRDVERELFKCLVDLDMAFYVYNPLAGGLLSGKYNTPDSLPESLPDRGRFSYHKSYPERYWKNDNHRAVAGIGKACLENDIPVLDAALGWLLHHSALVTTANWQVVDANASVTNACVKTPASESNAVILGASSLQQLQQNQKACARGPLPDAIVDAVDEAWALAQPTCIKYFRP